MYYIIKFIWSRLSVDTKKDVVQKLIALDRSLHDVEKLIRDAVEERVDGSIK